MHHDGGTPVNGNDQDCTNTGISAFPSQRKPLVPLDDDLAQFMDDVDESTVDEQEHNELVSRLMREGDALRTELGLPGFPSAGMLPSTSPDEAPERPLTEQAGAAVHETDPVPAHNAGSDRARRRRVPHRLGTSRTPRMRRARPAELVDLHHALAQVRAERELISAKSPRRRVRLGRAEARLVSIFMTGQVREYTVSERVRRMVVRHKADLLLWFLALYGLIFLTGISVPTWLSAFSVGLLPGLVVIWWRRLREDLHEPGIDQQPAPHKDDQRT